MRALPIAVVVVAALVLLPGLDRIGFIDVREARDALVARELLADREILTRARRLRGALRQADRRLRAGGAVARRARHHGEGFARAARLADAAPDHRRRVAGARHFGPRAGWMSAGVLATCLGTPLAARADGTQVLATLLGWLAAGAIADTLLVRPGSGRASFLLVAAAAIGDHARSRRPVAGAVAGGGRRAVHGARATPGARPARRLRDGARARDRDGAAVVRRRCRSASAPRSSARRRSSRTRSSRRARGMAGCSAPRASWWWGSSRGARCSPLRSPTPPRGGARSGGPTCCRCSAVRTRSTRAPAIRCPARAARRTPPTSSWRA